MSYQDQVGQLKDAGFSGQEVQNWSDNQAVKLRQGGFSQDEVDSYQGMKAPPPGQPPVYGRLPTDDDFKNAASVILKGNDHPWYEQAVENLKGLFADTGVAPTEAVKASQEIPTFRQIMENGGEATKGSYWQEAARGAATGIASSMRGLANIQAYSKDDNPLFDIEPGKNPEQYWLHQKGTAFQQWIDQKIPAQPEFESAHPIKTGVVSGLAQMPALMATGGIGMAAMGADSAYEQAKQAGTPIDKAVDFAGKSAALWGALGVTNVGVFMKSVERSAPGMVPWLVAKATQALRSGTTFAGTNELGDWLSSEIAQAADIPIQYKPTAQRIIVNGLTGAAMGPLSPTGVKRPSEVEKPPSEQPVVTESQPPPPTAPATQLTPAYHFDTDSYGLKNEKGEFVQTGFPTEQDARTNAEQAPAPTFPPQQRLEPEVIDRYKKTIADEAEKVGIPLTPEQLQVAAQKMAESHNPVVEAKKPEVTPAEPAFTTIPKKPLGLADFVRKAGGVNDEGGDVRSILGGARFRPGLVNGEGKSLDEMALAAHEAGYFTGDRPSVNDFLDKLSDDLHGRPQHSERDFDAAQAYHDALRYNQEVDRVSTETGIQAEGKTHTQFWDEVTKYYSRDQIAEKRTDFTQRAQEAYESWRTEALEPEERMTKEDLEHERTQDNIAKDQKSIAKSPGETGSAAEYTREGEEIGGLGGRGTESARGAGSAEETAGTAPTAVRAEPSERSGDAERGARAKPGGVAVEPLQDPMHGYGVTENGEHVGVFQTYRNAKGNAIQIMTSGIDNKFKGRGYGIEAYKQMADIALNKGKELWSDTQVSPAAAKMYEKLKDEGYEVTKHKYTVFNKDGDIVSKSNEPVFKVTGHERDKEELLYEKGNLNRGILSAVRDPQHMRLLEDVDKYLKRVLPPGWRYEVTPGLIKTDDGGVAYGLTDRTRKLITLSLQSPNQWVSAAHESLHAVRHLLTPEEWDALAKEAQEKGLQKKYNIESRYKDDREEEAVAHWIGDWKNNKETASKPAETLFKRITNVLKNIAAKIRSMFATESPEDIFKKIESGEVGQREGETGEGQLYEKAGAPAKEEERKPSLGEALKSIHHTLFPQMAGDLAKREAISLRENAGIAKREQAIAETALGEFSRQGAKIVTDPKQLMDFYNYAEGRSKGIQLENKQFQKMADTIRDIYGRYKDLIQSMPETRMQHFVTDYFPHMWADGQEKKIQDFMNSWWQQGSSRNLKERKIPTIADGLSYGLKLKEPNPVRATSSYVGLMNNYLSSIRNLRSIINDFGGSYYADGLQPDGFKPIVGRNAERIENARIDPVSGKIVPARNLHLYAPNEVADLYNVWHSKGWEDTGAKSIYQFARNAINQNTLFELGLSAYHFGNVAWQSFNQDFGRIARNFSAGDWQGVGEAIMGLVPGLHFMQGKQLEQQYLNLKNHGVDMEQMADYIAKANMRRGFDPLQDVATHGGFYEAWKRGELPALRDKLTKQLTEGYGIGALKTTGEVMSRVVSDVAHPIFKAYVPVMKMSAIHDLMGDWLRRHPTATDAEKSAALMFIGDRVEARFGEKNMENIFWHNKVKQLLGLDIRAPGWVMGYIDQAGGPFADIAHMVKDGIQGKKFNDQRLDRLFYGVGAIALYAAANSMATYLHTGIAPTDQELEDFIHFRTGGHVQSYGSTVPERGDLPGHMREFLELAPIPGKNWLSGFKGEVEAKQTSLPKNLWEAFNNENWRGDPLYDPKSKSTYHTMPLVPNIGHVIAGYEPFMSEQILNPKKGTHLTLLERFFGVRSSSGRVVNPEGVKAFNEKKHH